MFIFLLSATRPRYRKDILRVLAMPVGSQLQLRYASKWIDPIIWAQESMKQLNGRPSLLLYINQYDKAKTPEIVPLRFAKIIRASSHGTTATVILELADFAYTENIADFDSELKSASKDILPTWQHDGTIKGTYLFQISHELKKVIKPPTLLAWEKIVTQVAERGAFLDERCFYFVKGLYLFGKGNEISIIDNHYELASGHVYEIQIYHFHPKNAPQCTRLLLNTSSQQLSFVTNPVLTFDSRYDLKQVRMRISAWSSKTEDGVLSILRSEGNKPDELEFDLLIRMKRSFWRILGYGIALGVLLAAPQIIAIFFMLELPFRIAIMLSILFSVFSLGTGVFVAFGLKKPI